MGPAANHSQGGLVKNIAYRQDYILHGELSADAQLMMEMKTRIVRESNRLQAGCFHEQNANPVLSAKVIDLITSMQLLFPVMLSACISYYVGILNWEHLTGSVAQSQAVTSILPQPALKTMSRVCRMSSVQLRVITSIARTSNVTAALTKSTRKQPVIPASSSVVSASRPKDERQAVRN